jgi:hypothetical protein
MSESPGLKLLLVFGVFFDVSRQTYGIIFLIPGETMARKKIPREARGGEDGAVDEEAIRPRTSFRDAGPMVPAGMRLGRQYRGVTVKTAGRRLRTHHAPQRQMGRRRAKRAKASHAARLAITAHGERR